MKLLYSIITVAALLFSSCGGGEVVEENGDANATDDQNSSITSSDQNGSRLVIVTTTSDEEHSKSDDLWMYAHIIGLDDSRLNLGLLDNVDVDDREAAQVDTYSLPFDYPVSKIKGVELEVKGEDAWKAEKISFQFFESGKKSEPFSFDVDQWFSSEQADIDKNGAVPSKMFSFRPELE